MENTEREFTIAQFVAAATQGKTTTTQKQCVVATSVVQISLRKRVKSF
jgi:hypothetical protein